MKLLNPSVSFRTVFQNESYPDMDIDFNEAVTLVTKDPYEVLYLVTYFIHLIYLNWPPTIH